jgi:hypothetical protein
MYVSKIQCDEESKKVCKIFRGPKFESGTASARATRHLQAAAMPRSHTHGEPGPPASDVTTTDPAAGRAHPTNGAGAVVVSVER